MTRNLKYQKLEKSETLLDHLVFNFSYIKFRIIQYMHTMAFVIIIISVTLFGSNQSYQVKQIMNLI